MKRAAGVLLAASIALVACGLDLSGTAQPIEDGGAPPDAAPLDATTNGEGGADASPQPDGAALDASPDAIVGNDSGGGDGGGETDCLDGIDNDGNGKTDCADPACNPVVTCVPIAAPPGWTGYSLVDPTGTLACPTSYPTKTDAFANLNAPAASCSACTCTASGVTCPFPTTLDCRGNANCTQNPNTTVSLSDSSVCLQASFTLGINDFCAVAPITPTGGRCDASTVVATKSPPTFGDKPRICGAPKLGGGCAAGNQCVARGGGGFTGICVARSIADGAPLSGCPGGYTLNVVTSPTASSYTDTRDCTACGCNGAPQGASCNVSATLYTSNDCTTGAQAPIPADGTCRSNVVSNNGTSIQSTHTATTINQGTCSAPTGGQPTGSAAAITRTQYCCK